MMTLNGTAVARLGSRLALASLTLATTLTFIGASAGQVSAAPLTDDPCPVKFIKAPTPAEYQAACGKYLNQSGKPIDPGIGNGQPPAGQPPKGNGPASNCGPQQTQVGNNTGTIKVNCTTVNNTNTGVQNTNSNNGTNVGTTTTTGTGNNTATGNQVQGNGNVITGGGNTVQGNNATNVNGSNNTVTNVTGVGNTVNSNNKTVTNVTQVQNTTQIVDAPPSEPTVVYVQQPAPAPAPAPAPETVTVVVATDLGLSIDRGLGAEYATGDPLGIGYTVSRPMQVEIAFVTPTARVVVYSGGAEGPGNLTTVVPPVSGVMLLEMVGTADDGSTAREVVWFTIK